MDKTRAGLTLVIAISVGRFAAEHRMQHRLQLVLIL